MTSSRRKSCSACVKAKRRCDLRLPQCRRCSARGLRCQYESGIEAAEQRHYSSAPFAIDELFDFSSLEGLTADPHPQPNGSDQHLAAPMLDSNLNSALLLPVFAEVSPQQDVTEPVRMQEIETSDAPLLYIQELRNWLSQWVTKGGNPFIHPKLYYQTIPPEIQDAYTCCSIYSTKNDNNQNIVFRIVEERVASLLNSQQNRLRLSLREHLSRVQCLFIYQIIRLFDGDIRQRALAEQHAPILTTWLHEMWDALANSGLDIYHDDSSNSTPSPLSPPMSVVHSELTTNTNTTTLWANYLLTECTRRTWLAARVTAVFYDTMKGKVTNCPGVTPFIGSTAIWEAATPYRWAQAWRERGRGCLVTSDSVKKLVETVRASEIDAFGRVVIMLRVKGEVFERWMEETG
ncbi:hypothetical protein AJ79_03728 [Helicocarpus griseus UAMH5409]|uniref:Zn(2)-C6 fungal-type domain-containing protein n=1 Tax=Helicocarpus griseus UAMH5409 TaxID=1447875 RepID=A0A2B7XXG1_9EURO|nr:hypothetical protein AJ79_03728 [Helicocarpus griseus UAMH5409]